MPRTMTKVLRSIDEIPEAEWDSILSPEDIFHTHRFIKVVELSKIEDSIIWPICFYENGVLVASAMLSAFRIDLGLFLSHNQKEQVKKIRKLIPNFLKPRILFCGLPVSFSQRNLIISKPQKPEMILTGLDQKMKEIAKEHNIKYLIFKEFDPMSVKEIMYLKKIGYFKADSVPSVDLKIRWSSYKEYLDNMRHSYRRQIKASLNKLNSSDPHREPPIQIILENDLPPEAFYERYLKVLNRAETKLESLNLAFFKNCFELMKNDISIITVRNKNELLSAALLFHHYPYLNFALVGNKFSKLPEIDPYFNIIHQIVKMAIETGTETVKLGQTTYWIKQRIGGEISERFIFFKAKNKLMHLIIKSIRTVLFPKLSFPGIRVFKD